MKNMKKYLAVAVLCLNLSPVLYAQGIRMLPVITPAGKGKVNTRIDNIGYWHRMVQMGYVRPDAAIAVPEARFDGTQIIPYGAPAEGNRHPSLVQNSPDVPVTGETEVTQSENSVYSDPNEEEVVLNSNNSSNWVSGYAETAYGADALWSLTNGGQWNGTTQGINGNNAGDPAVAIGRNGWWYVGRITADYGQAVSYSKDQGKSWKRVKVGDGPTIGLGLLDKNHLAIDNSLSSPYEGNVYAAWTNFIPNSPDTNQVQIVRSTDRGVSWWYPVTISTAVAGQKLNHGVNVQTGPAGEVYAAWSIYDTWPSDETAIGFARSFNGGGVFQPAMRILTNLKGIRASMTGKNMRVNSFPSMAVDNSSGPHRGTVYVVWSNRGVPGINTGNDLDIYLVKSTDQGSTWSSPVRVNQDPAGQGNEHYFPWITCDPVTGGLCVIYYDDRNADSTQAATFVSYSYDGGNSWTDLQVSDNTFTPEPIPGLAFSYFGDYIGIQSNNMKVYPVWTDNHDDGRAMAYTSPFDLGPNPNQPWVVYYSDSLARVTGTSNGNLNYGDSLYLTLGLKNIGDQPVADVNAVITSSSPFVVMTDSTASYGAMAPGEVKSVTNGMTLDVSDTIPDNLRVRFDVRVTGTDSTWYSHFSLEAHAPALAVNGITVIDTLLGNHNGRIDPGETVQLIVPVANGGDFACPGTWVSLSTASPYLTLLTDSVSLGNIPPKLVKTGVFTATVSPSTPAGTGVDIVAAAHSGLFKARRTIRLVVGMVVEDWESHSFTKFPWMQGGTMPWALTGVAPWEGNYAAASGVIGDYQSSQLFITYTSVNNDSISFYYKTSSEQDYDFLMFTIDGLLQGQWSGETPWSRTSFPVTAGEHIFKWIYAKDLAMASGQDRVWVDFIALPAPVLPVVEPGPDDTVCAGSAALLQAMAQHCDSVVWTTQGDGVFTNDTALITSYLPGPGDIAGGQATLLLTAYSRYGNSAGDKQLVILPRPVANILSILPNDSVCNGQTIHLTADTAGILAWRWNPGNFTGTTVGYDTLTAGGTGTRRIVLTVTDNRCSNRDTVNLTFSDCSGSEELLPETISIHPNPGSGLFFTEIDTPKPSPLQLCVRDALNVVVWSDEDPVPVRHRLKKIDLSFLPDGVYLLTITTPRGTSTHKLILRK